MRPAEEQVKDDAGNLVFKKNGEPLMIRPMEVRELNEDFADAITARIMHNPFANTLDSLVWIPDLASAADFDYDAFSNGEYKAYVIGGSHKTQAKKTLVKMSNYENVEQIKYEMAVTYGGMYVFYIS
jgi:hypothetical protein